MQSDAEALAAFQLCAKLEGIVPAPEPAHALAKVFDATPQKPEGHVPMVNISGRGDKDIFTWPIIWAAWTAVEAPAKNHIDIGNSSGDK